MLECQARTRSAELLECAIRVDAISLGQITTLIYSRLGIPEADRSACAAAATARVPIQRFGSAAGLAWSVMFTRSPDTSSLLGASLGVDRRRSRQPGN